MEDDKLRVYQAQDVAISIHVLRVEDDLALGFTGRQALLFQSTSSVWRTTLLRDPLGNPGRISIHVLRVEDDAAARPARQSRAYFNPRPPCGGRPSLSDSRRTRRNCHFNPRPPCGGRHKQAQGANKPLYISIHVLRVEDDAAFYFVTAQFAPFQSTSSVWRTTQDRRKIAVGNLISIHVLRVEDDS